MIYIREDIHTKELESVNLSYDIEIISVEAWKQNMERKISIKNNRVLVISILN